MYYWKAAAWSSLVRKPVSIKLGLERSCRYPVIANGKAAQSRGFWQTFRKASTGRWMKFRVNNASLNARTVRASLYGFSASPHSLPSPLPLLLFSGIYRRICVLVTSPPFRFVFLISLVCNNLEVLWFFPAYVLDIQLFSDLAAYRRSLRTGQM